MCCVYGEILVDPVHLTSWRITPCRLSASLYSVYSQPSQLPSGERLLKLEDAPLRSEKPPFIMAICNILKERDIEKLYKNTSISER
jgi:hypothetical protein